MSMDLIEDIKAGNEKEIKMILGSLGNLKGGMNDLVASAERTAKLPKKPIDSHGPSLIKRVSIRKS